MLTEDLVEDALSLGMIQRKDEISFLLGFLRDRPLCNILEIGSESGGTFYLWCKLAECKKISVDLPSGASGSCKYNSPEKTAERESMFKSWADDVHVITGNSQSLDAVAEVAKILNGETVDLLFIDGDHSEDGARKDFEVYGQFVAVGGLVVFHDIKDTAYHREAGCFVSNVWNELKGCKISICDESNWGGIGILVKQ